MNWIETHGVQSIQSIIDDRVINKEWIKKIDENIDLTSSLIINSS